MTEERRVRLMMLLGTLAFLGLVWSSSHHPNDPNESGAAHVDSRP